MNKILLLEDDMLLSQSISDMLEDEGFETICVPNGEVALEAVYENRFDLYLLDINVPLLNGIEFLQNLREANDTTPSIFLTSHKEKLKEGFLSGCDDYVTKPFDNEELILRIKALLNRTQPNMEKIGRFTCDDAHKSIYLDDKRLELTKREYELLRLLIANTGKIVTKEMIQDRLWGLDESGSDGAIRVYINRIKQLLDGVMEIQNIRGVGYCLVS